MQKTLPKNAIRNGAIIGGIALVAVLAISSVLRITLPASGAIIGQGGEKSPGNGAVVNNFYGQVTLTQNLSPVSTEKPSQIAQNFPAPIINGNCNAVGVANSVNCAPQSRAPNDALSLRLTDEFRAAGSYKLKIVAIMGDQEAFQYASKLSAIFKDAGWSIDGVDQAIYNVPMMGLLISMGPENGRSPGTKVSLETLPPAAAALIKVFRENNIDVIGNIDNAIKDANEVQLIVGGRP